MKKKIGLFGGSFDPFHLGHERMIDAALASGEVSRVLVMPCGLPPHKTRRLSLAAYRYSMLEAALQGRSEVELSRYELQRPGQYSYTSETLKALRREAREKGEKISLSLIYGSDALETMDSWHKPRKILKQAPMLIALRGNDSEKREFYESRARALMDRYGGEIRFFPMEPIELSSTEWRERLARGENPNGNFNPAVAAFLVKNKPYLFAEDMNQISDEAYTRLAVLEQEIWEFMPLRRLVHTANVCQYAVHLALRHGQDADKAALAGLLHDVCKYMPVARQMKLAEAEGSIYPLNPNIAHGPAGAVYARDVFGMKDPLLLNAIARHTTTVPGMNDLDKIIYLSDKIEWGRDFNYLDEIREAAELDLNLAMKLCLREVLLALVRQHKKIHPQTLSAAKDYGIDPQSFLRLP